MWYLLKLKCGRSSAQNFILFDRLSKKLPVLGPLWNSCYSKHLNGLNLILYAKLIKYGSLEILLYLSKSTKFWAELRPAGQKIGKKLQKTIHPIIMHTRYKFELKNINRESEMKNNGYLSFYAWPMNLLDLFLWCIRKQWFEKIIEVKMNRKYFSYNKLNKKRWIIFENSTNFPSIWITELKKKRKMFYLSCRIHLIIASKIRMTIILSDAFAMEIPYGIESGWTYIWYIQNFIRNYSLIIE